MKPTQKITSISHGMEVELDAPWGTLDVSIGYLVHIPTNDSPQLFELIGVWLDSTEISRHLNQDYLFDLIADHYQEGE